MNKTIAIGIVVFLACLILVPSVSATWCDANYGKKAPILINNTGGSAQTYYQVELNITHDSDMNANFSDIRVYNESDCSLVPLWNESAVASSWNKIWFNATNIPTSSWTNDTYYLYYDYSSASSVSSGDDTFEFFDDFERSNISGNIINPWTRYASNPVFVKNATNSWDSYFVNDPEICKHLNGTPYQDASNNYFMYYSGSGHDDAFNNDQIGLALSTDLSNWTRYGVDGGRVLKFGDGTFEDGAWDDADVQLGTVLYDSGTFHMWYNGNNNPSTDYCRLGYANSTDGKSWTKYTSNPILSQGSDGDADDLYVPAVIYDNSTWKMWYAGQKTGGGRIAVMYATASNPEGPWTKYSNAHIYDTGYNMFPTSVWNESGVFHMIFFPLTVTDMRHATSTNGINWTYDGIIFERGGSGEWDDHHIQEISQILVDSTWYTFYTGGGDANVFSNGYATSTVRVPTPGVSKWSIYEGTEGTNLRLNNGKLEVGMTAAASSVISATFPAPFVINSYIDFATSGASTSYSYIGPSNANIQSHFGYNSYIGTTKWNLYKYPANTNTLFGTALSEYKDVEIKVQSSSQEGWIGSDDATSDTDFGATEPYIRIYGNNGVTYVEFVFIRKYTSPEPTAQLGNEESPILYTPPNPTNLQNTTGNYWVNYTWAAGSGNVTNGYNVSWNSTWDNTTNAFMNKSVGASGWANITVYAWNSSSSGTISAGNVSDEVQVSGATDTSFTVTLPVGYSYAHFNLTGVTNPSTQTNYEPEGQNSTEEFYNVTNTGNVNLDVRMQLNSTITNVILKADTDNNPVGSKEVNTSLVTIYSGLVQDNSIGIWMWTNLSHAIEQTTNKTLSINVSQ